MPEYLIGFLGALTDRSKTLEDLEPKETGWPRQTTLDERWRATEPTEGRGVGTGPPYHSR